VVSVLCFRLLCLIVPVYSGLLSACVWHIYVCAVVMLSKVNEDAGASKGEKKACNSDTEGRPVARHHLGL
jgi:hypothetical protein